MDRREFFLNVAKASGVVLPWWGLLPLPAKGQTQMASKILCYVHFDGGPVSDYFGDPSAEPRYNLYTQQGLAIPGSGNLRWAPIGNNTVFFNRFRDQILMVNGINTLSNSHNDGARCMATGKLEMGFPALGELHAAAHAPGFAAGWMLRDNDTTTTGVYPATAIPDQNQLRAMIDPLAQNGTTDYVNRAHFNKTVAARTARIEALRANGAMLPKESAISAQVLAGAEARQRLLAVAANIPTVFGPFPDIEVPLIAAQSGITAAIQIQTGGFDTHGNVADNDGANGSFARATNRLTYLWEEAGRRGIADRLFVVAGGEFSRTELNGSNGDDHDNVGAFSMIMGPVGWGMGNRVVGCTGPMHSAVAINPKTGAVDPNGVMLTPAHVHQQLQEYLGAQPTNPMLGLGVPANERISLFDTNMRTGYPFLTA
jgi:Protein of unknown function (DUF1501)